MAVPVIIVGSGHGLRVHLPALRRVGFDVVGLVGNDAERTRRRARRAGIPGAFTDLGQAIDETGARAVTVASPSSAHHPLVMTAIEHGCHVMCEKPFASNAGEAQSMCEAAERAGVVNILGNQLRASPERIVGGRAIAEGLIGEPRYLTFVQHINMLAEPTLPWPAWWFDRQAGGGWLGASGSHMIDHVRSWLGEFVSTSASLSVSSQRSGDILEDTFIARFALENGLEGVITQCAAAWGPMAQMTRVIGTHGTLWLEDGKAFIADSTGTRELPIPADLSLERMEPSDNPREKYLHVELPPSLKLFGAFYDAIENGGDVAPFATFHDGLQAMRVIDAIRESARRGGECVACDGVGSAG